MRLKQCVLGAILLGATPGSAAAIEDAVRLSADPPPPAAAPATAPAPVAEPAAAAAAASAADSPAAAPLPATALPADPFRRAIALRLEGSEPVMVGPAALDGAALRTLYGGGFAPLWIGPEGPLPKVAELLQALSGAAAEGLDPADYYPRQLAESLARDDIESRATAELLLSAAVMRYGAELQGGRLNPRRLSRTFDIAPKEIDRPAIARTAAAADLPRYLQSLAPARPAYDGLRRALAAHRAVAAAGGWPAVPDGPSLRPGEQSDRVPALRARLAVTGEFTGDAAERSRVYDEATVAAVVRFQEQHGLAADGVVGQQTLAALNVDAATRGGQILATMEHWRWLPDDLGERHLMVNVPDYSLDVVEHGQVIRRMLVIVGRTDRQTPLFSSALTWLEFNPTWTVPTSIAYNDWLPRLRRNSGALEQHNIRVFSGWGAGAVELSPHQIDWESMGGGIRRLMLRQQPGPENSLGKVKFMMANNFSVYLHDTPSRHLFGRERRVFSSGCVRVQDPMWLAEYLLQGNERWAAQRERILQGWTTTRVTLTERMPLHIAYWTAWRDDAGRINFREDVYGLDAVILDALARRSAREHHHVAQAG